MSSKNSYSRRDFLKVTSVVGSGLAIGLHLPFANKLFGSQDKVFSPNVFIDVLENNNIIISVSKSEMGQGIWTSLPMLIAEEMEANWDNVTVKQADGARVNSFFGTGGSSSISRDGWNTLRNAGAVAKVMLVEAAAKKWNVSPVECNALNSSIIHERTGKTCSFGEVTAIAARLKVPKEAPLKHSSKYTILGKDFLRTDTGMKVNGTAPFAMDIDLEGMVYAMIERPKTFGAIFKSLDDSKAKSMSGIIDIFTVPSGVAIVGNNIWSIIQARKELKIEWTSKTPINNDSDVYKKYMEELSTQSGHPARDDGDANEILNSTPSARQLESIYDLPFQTHASMEPCNSVIDIKKDSVEIWAPTQSPKQATDRASELTGIPIENIKVNVTFLGGSFGRKSFNDFIDDGIYVSKIIKKPVKIVWSREDDIRHGYNRPASKHVMNAALGDNEKVIAWKHKVISPDALNQQAVYQYGAMMPGILKGVMGLLPGFVKKRMTIIGEGAKSIKYEFSNTRIETKTFETDVPLGFWRSVYDSQNAFANESFIDEISNKINSDPVELRLVHLKGDSRASAVIKRAAKESGWKTKTLAEGHYQGFAYHHSFGSHVAEVAEVSVSDSNNINIHKVTCVIDCGQTVNPLTIRAQMEGSIVFGISATTKSEVTVTNGRVDQSNYDSFEVLRMDEMPEIDVYIIKNTKDPGGVGEPGLPPIAPAIANAVFAATGKRIRKLPIRPSDLRV